MNAPGFPGFRILETWKEISVEPEPIWFRHLHFLTFLTFLGELEYEDG